MNEEALRNCLILSKLAYKDSFHYTVLGFDHVTHIDNNGTQLYIVEDGDSVYYVFRGTELDEWQDIITDLRATKKNFREGHMHRGFYKAFGEVREELFEVRKKRNLKKKKAYLTGHSLGGALARVLAEYLHEVQAIHTFGEPRSGCVKLEKEYKHNDKHYRWVMHNDIVTRFPLVSMHFKHVGRLMYIDRNRTICPDASSFKRGWEFARGGVCAKLEDHFMDSYLQTLGPLFIKQRGKLGNL